MASRSLGTLTLDLVAKTKGFVEGLSQADRETQKRVAKIKREFDSAAKAVRKYALIASAAITATAATVALIVNANREAIDSQAKLAKSLNTTVKGLQVYTRAGELSGVALTQVEQLTKDFTRRLSQAAAGTGPAVDALARLNLTAADLVDLPLDERIELINQRLLDFVPAAERAAVAGQLFGEEGSLNALRTTPETIAQARREVDQFGIALSQVDAAKVEAANDALSGIALFRQGFGQRLTVELSPLFVLISRGLVDMSEKAGGADNLFKQLFADIADYALIAATAIRAVGLTIGNVYQTVEEKVQGAFAAVGQSAKDARTQWLVTFEVIRGNLPTEALRETFEESRERLRALGYEFEKELSVDATLTDIWSNLFGEINSSEWLARQREALASIRTEIEQTVPPPGATFDPGEGGDTMQSAAQIAAEERLAELLKEHRDLITGVDDATYAYNETLRELNELLQAGSINQETFDAAIQRAADARQEDLEKGKKDLEGLSAYADEAARSMQGAFADFLFDPFDKGLKGMLQSFADTLQRMAAEAAAAAIFDSIFGAGSGSGQGGGLGSMLASIFGGGREYGGPVMAGAYYEVGEANKPEIFRTGGRQYLIPGNSGEVQPLNGAGVVQNFNIATPNADSFRASQRQIAKRGRQGLGL